MFMPCIIRGLIFLVISHGGAQANNSASGPELGELVQRYMLLDDPSQRAEVAKKIEHDPLFTPQRVSQAIRQLSVWKQMPQRRGRLDWSDRQGNKYSTKYRLPLHYDPTQAYPLILSHLLFEKDMADSFVVVSLPAGLPLAFHQPPDAHADLSAMLYTLRRSIHIDAQRIYLCAPSDVGWLLLSTYPDLFTSVLLDGEPLWLPYAAQLYAIYFENFRHVTIQWVLSNDLVDQDNPSSLLVSYLDILGQQKNIPLKITNVDSGQTLLDYLSENWIPSLGKHDTSSYISHWYRFPSQGRTSWLSAIKYKGAPWSSDQLSIVVNPTVDRDAYITGVLKDRLAYLGGRIQGQTIEVETRRCERVSWRLYEHSIDWSKPITLRCNGRRRFEGHLKPSIAIMLESARVSWDFSRPVWMSRSLTIRSDAPDS